MRIVTATCAVAVLAGCSGDGDENMGSDTPCMEYQRMNEQTKDATVTLMLEVLEGSDPSSEAVRKSRTEIDTKCLLVGNKNTTIGKLAG